MRVPMFGIGLYSKSPNVTAQRRINLYYEFSPQEDKTAVAAYGTPGLELFVDFGDTPCRGEYAIGDYNYIVHRGTLWEVNNAGVKTSIGTLNTTDGKVGMSDNGVQLMITDGTDGYIYQINAIAPQTISSITNVGTTATLTTASPHGLPDGSEVTISGAVAADYNGTFRITVTGTNTFTYTMLSNPGGAASVVGSYTVSRFVVIESAFPENPTSVTYLAGYFVCTFLNSGRFYISAIRNGLVWDALDFANAETNPDNLVRVYSDHGELILLGEYTTEFWGVSGAVDFPFSFISGASIEWGLVSPWTVAKNEDSIIFLARNRMGQSRVVMLRGYTPIVISGQDLDYILNEYTAIDDASAYGYMLGGHPFYQISFPTGDATWLYDQSTNVWSQLISNNLNRHRTELHTTFINENVVTDFSNGRVYRMKPDVYTDNGEPIARELIGRHIYQDLDPIFVSEFEIDMQTGVGLISGQGSNPQVMLQISKDGGHTWGTELWRSCGAIGKYLTRVIWRRLGRGRDWVFKVRITDPVKVVIIGAYMDMLKGR